MARPPLFSKERLLEAWRSASAEGPNALAEFIATETCLRDYLDVIVKHALEKLMEDPLPKTRKGLEERAELQLRTVAIKMMIVIRAGYRDLSVEALEAQLKRSEECPGANSESSS